MDTCCLWCRGVGADGFAKIDAMGVDEVEDLHGFEVEAAKESRVGGGGGVGSWSWNWSWSWSWSWSGGGAGGGGLLLLLLLRHGDVEERRRLFNDLGLGGWFLRDLSDGCCVSEGIQRRGTKSKTD